MRQAILNDSKRHSGRLASCCVAAAAGTEGTVRKTTTHPPSSSDAATRKAATAVAFDTAIGKAAVGPGGGARLRRATVAAAGARGSERCDELLKGGR